MVLSFINKYLGWRNWAVLHYNSIFENLFLVFFIVGLSAEFSGSALLNCSLFLLLSMIATSFGYLINDFSDRKLDREHGKANTFENDSTGKAVAVLSIFGVATLLLAVPFLKNKYFLILFILWFIVALQYSLPPGRFKERGVSGLILVSMAQRLLPVWMLLTLFLVNDPILIILISVYIMLRGLTSDLNHQLQDFEHDRETGTMTSVVRQGHKSMMKTFSVLLELERIALIIFLLKSALTLEGRASFNYVLYAASAIYGVIFLWAEIIRWRSELSEIGQWNPYTEKNVFQFVQLVFPNIILPLLLLFYLVWHNFLYAFFFLFYFFIFKLYDPVTIKNSFLGRLLKIN